MKSFPAPGLAPRSILAQGRWTGIRIPTDSTMVGNPAMEVPVSGRRVIVQSADQQFAYSVFNADPLVLIQEQGTYCPDPALRIALWFDAPGEERVVTVPLFPPHYRLFGSGIYVPVTTPIDYIVSFDKLFIQVFAMGLAYYHPEIVLNVEQWTKEKGDQS